jgi:16S rRNA (guanine527-N7)-methyltransferase
VSRPPDRALDALLHRHRLPTSAARPLGVLLALLADPQAPTSVHDPERAIDVHIADSLVGLEVSELRSARVIADLGAGAGLPGLVLAAALSEARIVLVEAGMRKCEFLREAVVAMGLANVDVVRARAEEWRDGIGRCDVVCARALAAMPVLCEYAAPLLHEGGLLVAWKGDVSEAEAADGVAAAAHLGLAVEEVRSVVPFRGSERRTLHLLRKVAPTPERFPRRPGLATKRPLSVKNPR